MRCEVRGNDMGLQLGVERTAHPVPIRRSDQTLGRLDTLPAFAAAHHHSLLLQIRQRSPTASSWHATGSPEKRL
jgi:hypothetical protein